MAPDPRLVRAKARLDRLDWYPEPVRIEGVRIAIAPWFFRIPGLRRFDGYAWPWLILLRSETVSDDLITHELCHVWQLQHRPLALVLSYPLEGYASNRFEVQARRGAGPLTNASSSSVYPGSGCTGGSRSSQCSARRPWSPRSGAPRRAPPPRRCV